jgi:hypothetical protein
MAHFHVVSFGIDISLLLVEIYREYHQEYNRQAAIDACLLLGSYQFRIKVIKYYLFTASNPP